VYIYGSYRKIKTGVSLFWTTRYNTIQCNKFVMRTNVCHLAESEAPVGQSYALIDFALDSLLKYRYFMFLHAATHLLFQKVTRFLNQYTTSTRNSF